MQTPSTTLPGADLDAAKMPGHWLLARLGKRVLRPGGLELTRWMLEDLDVTGRDEVVEFAPGLGTTTRMTLERRPATFVAVDRDPAAAERVTALLAPHGHRCISANASETGLPDHSATVVYGEAMLTMQPPEGKRRIVAEAARLLRRGGRYGIHEMGLRPDDLLPESKRLIGAELSRSIHVGARPLTVAEWKALLEENGFRVRSAATTPMHLLEPGRLLQDEGVAGVARITWNLLRDPVARARVLDMRHTFRRFLDSMCGVSLVAVRVEG